MKKFVRSLPDDLLPQLEKLAADKKPNWWRDILSHEQTDLHFAIRRNYLSVYAKGQSVFKIELGKDSTPLMTTHYKYLLRPKMPSKMEYATFDGKKFRMGGKEIDPGDLIQSSYVEKQTINELVRAAMTYSDPEKSGVHAIANANPNVIDMEVAFSEKKPLEDPAKVPEPENSLGRKTEWTARRIDLVALQPEGQDKARVVFYEAKRFDDARLWGAKPEVVEQLDRYSEFVSSNERDLKEAYTAVCKILANLRKVGSTKSLSSLIIDVARDKRELVVDKSCCLVVFGFGQDQKRASSDQDQKVRRLDQIKKALGPGRRMISKGTPTGLKLT